MPTRTKTIRREELPLHLEHAAQAHEAQHRGVHVTAITIETQEPVTAAEEADEILAYGGDGGKGRSDGSGVPVALAFGAALATSSPAIHGPGSWDREAAPATTPRE